MPDERGYLSPRVLVDQRLKSWPSLVTWRNRGGYGIDKVDAVQVEFTFALSPFVQDAGA